MSLPEGERLSRGGNKQTVYSHWGLTSPTSAPTPTPATTLTFWSSVLLLAAFTCRVTSSSGFRGHLAAPAVLLLAGGLWLTSMTTPGEAVMPKDV